MPRAPLFLLPAASCSLATEGRHENERRRINGRADKCLFLAETIRLHVNRAEGVYLTELCRGSCSHQAVTTQDSPLSSRALRQEMPATLFAGGRPDGVSGLDRTPTTKKGAHGERMRRPLPQREAALASTLASAKKLAAGQASPALAPPLSEQRTMASSNSAGGGCSRSGENQATATCKEKDGGKETKICICVGKVLVSVTTAKSSKLQRQRQAKMILAVDIRKPQTPNSAAAQFHRVLALITSSQNSSRLFSLFYRALLPEAAAVCDFSQATEKFLLGGSENLPCQTMPASESKSAGGITGIGCVRLDFFWACFLHHAASQAGAVIRLSTMQSIKWQQALLRWSRRPIVSGHFGDLGPGGL
ncbi:uncharacterized protein TrAFT101_003656 [Trichoderma asperellum]|uniref:uncharacterized protein n=1 Tax=Trichoderma asperellum TaxID=101201 RepID=UPI00332EBF83|nr:hypothetical protein TrAFT101_003656 [Trichoderma asperellum]